MTRAGCRASRLRRRYGCFKLPRVRGAAVKEVHQKNVSWLARTDPKAKTIEFSEHFENLTPEQQKYIVAHEKAHLETGTDHNDRFFEVLKRLVAQGGLSWRVAYDLEIANCHKDH